MKVKGVSSFDLFYSTCEHCGELNIHGFPHSLETKTTTRFVWFKLECRKCGAVRGRRYPLTSGKGRQHRILPWVDLAYKLIFATPSRLSWVVPKLVWCALWLEHNLPL